MEDEEKMCNKNVRNIPYLISSDVNDGEISVLNSPVLSQKGEQLKMRNRVKKMQEFNFNCIDYGIHARREQRLRAYAKRFDRGAETRHQRTRQNTPT